MAFVLADRVRETTTTVGTGTVTLGGAVTGFQSFSAIGNANNTYYAIAGQGTSEWEVGIGTYTASGTTLSRDTVLASSNAGALVSFSAGTKDVFCDYPAAKALNYSTTGTVDIVGTTSVAVSSSTAALRITQTGAGNALLVEDSTNPDSTPTVIDALGSVINGYTTPLSIGTFTPRYQQHGNSSNFRSLSVSSWQAGTDTGAEILLSRGDNTTIGDYTLIGATDVLGNVRFYGADGTEMVEAAKISAAVDGTPGTNDMPGRLTFSTTADGASSPTERMRIDSAGQVGIGTTSITGYNLRVGKNMTGSTAPVGIASTGVVQSDATNNAQAFRTNISTQATSFTLPALYHYAATQATLGAGSTVTNQYGYFVDASLNGATNNYGFYSNIAAATGRWNFYANGTAQNYFAGNVGIGTGKTTPAVPLDVNGEARATEVNATNGIFVNSATVSEDYTIPSGSNAGTFGPVTVASGITVTVPSGSVWTVV